MRQECKLRKIDRRKLFEAESKTDHQLYIIFKVIESKLNYFVTLRPSGLNYWNEVSLVFLLYQNNRI